MVGAIERRETIDRWCGIAEAGSLFITTLSAALVRLPANLVRPAWLPYQPYLWFVVVGGPISTWIFKIVKQKYGRPNAWGILKLMIDEVRKDIFDGVGNSEVHTERVTLFRRKGCKFGLHVPCLGGCLVPVERSGHATRRSKALFRVRDDGRAEGVAGKGWFSDSPIYAQNLPEMTEDSSPQQIRDYARGAFMSEKDVKLHIENKKKLPRSLYAMRVESDRAWGVLVVDSRHPDIQNRSKIDDFVAKSGKLLAKVLKEI